MWSLFPELIGPIAAAFVVGSSVAWIVISIVLPRHPDERDYVPPSSTRPKGP